MRSPGAGNAGTSTTVTFSVSNTTSGAEPILNGGFESGAASWTQTSGVIGAFTGQPAHGGTQDAWMNGYGTGYTQKSLSLAAYKGQTIRLRFYGVEDSSLQTSFVIDDVSVK